RAGAPVPQDQSSAFADPLRAAGILPILVLPALRVRSPTLAIALPGVLVGRPLPRSRKMHLASASTRPTQKLMPPFGLKKLVVGFGSETAMNCRPITR